MTEADILALTYEDRCTVFRPYKAQMESGETIFKKGLEGERIYESLPCALARATGGKLARKTPIIQAEQEYTLFTRPEVEIRETDTVQVTQLGRTFLVEVGRGAFYVSHNEYPANLRKGQT